jgi:hypothetical protein
VEHVDPAITRRFDTKSSRPCEFCKEFDPHFRNRQVIDQMVISTRKAVASSHITEDGYVRHRILELRRIRARTPMKAVPVSAA